MYLLMSKINAKKRGTGDKDKDKQQAKDIVKHVVDKMLFNYRNIGEGGHLYSRTVYFD
jgi:hypothetical protein